MTGQTLVEVMCRFWHLRRGPPVTSTSSRGTDTQIRSTTITTRRSGRTIVLDARRNRSPFLFRRATTPCFEASVAVNMLVQNRQENYRHAYVVNFFFFDSPCHCHRHPLLPLNPRDRGPICQRLPFRLFTSIFTSKWLARQRSSPNGALPLAAKTLLCFICTNRRQGQYLLHFAYHFSFYYRDTCLILALQYMFSFHFTFNVFTCMFFHLHLYFTITIDYL